MNIRPCRTAPVRPRRPALAALGGFLLCLALLSAPARADIYRWQDGDGTIHFTDDISNIPSEFRKGSILLIREAPSGSPLAGPPPPGPAPPAPPAGTAPPGLSAAERAALEAARRKEELVSEVEQLRAKIAAKENHMRSVDAKRSLAGNPLRNRFVDQPDLDLYAKYEAELPADRERLKELEARLDTLR